MIAFSSWASFKSAVWSFHFRAYSTYFTYLISFRSNNILILPHVWDIAENEIFYLNLHCFIEITFELLLTHHYSNRFACSTFLDSDGQFFFALGWFLWKRKISREILWATMPQTVLAAIYLNKCTMSPFSRTTNYYLLWWWNHCQCLIVRIKRSSVQLVPAFSRIDSW